MNDDVHDLRFVRKHLRTAMPPVSDAGLKADLWPRMHRRLDETPAAFGWFESVLVGSVALTFALFPDLIPWMLYHL